MIRASRAGGPRTAAKLREAGKGENQQRPNKGMHLTRSALATRNAALAGDPQCSADVRGGKVADCNGAASLRPLQPQA